MTQKEYKNLFDEDDAVGWLEIDKVVEGIYGDQKPRHYAPPVHYMLGGEDPLDGVSIYDSKKDMFHRHLVSYGMSELYYNEEAAGGEFSKWGFEFTFRLKPFAEDGDDPTWVVNLMNNLARYVIKSGKWFEEYHVIPANGPIRLNSTAEINIVGVAFVSDPELGKIQTPHGEVSFLQMVGFTANEMNRITSASSAYDEVKKVLDEMKTTNPLMITDLLRR
ncbi:MULTISPECIES: suppressor of fused domain protein [Dysgonomonas]|uniref:suppressor of fused domain protein n=1 Tax=Dysgonomonas TaxID=156973 RepID=UPI00092A8FBA|nr:MULTISPECIES: suppressor of fused domain protein [Dysgonomonas]MBN9301960.1 suppressor of fused domain protein [Dysgonomonas mossii]OJX61888.1 MAG: riboflavin biosynthesis protein [Dysgonomonas sp. 37-18]